MTKRWYNEKIDIPIRRLRLISFFVGGLPEISSEATANGKPSRVREHVWGSEPSSTMMALKTLETVWTYAVVFLERSQVRPINWQSLWCILGVLSSSVLLASEVFLDIYDDDDTTKNVGSKLVRPLINSHKAIVSIQYSL